VTSTARCEEAVFGSARAARRRRENAPPPPFDPTLTHSFLSVSSRSHAHPHTLSLLFLSVTLFVCCVFVVSQTSPPPLQQQKQKKLRRSLRTARLLALRTSLRPFEGTLVPEPPCARAARPQAAFQSAARSREEEAGFAPPHPVPLPLPRPPGRKAFPTTRANTPAMSVNVFSLPSLGNEVRWCLHLGGRRARAQRGRSTARRRRRKGQQMPSLSSFARFPRSLQPLSPATRVSWPDSPPALAAGPRDGRHWR
jgi:hypothetical protein